MFNLLSSRSRKTTSLTTHRQESTLLNDMTVETLENRRMLAGNVTVDVDNGDLDIRGEGNVEQAISVEATSVEGRFLVTALDDTLINGQEGPVFVNGVTGDVDIDLRSGGKILILSESAQEAFVVEGDLDIDTRGGDADIILLDTVHVRGETTIRTRGGDDAVSFIGGEFDDELDVSTGGGNDVISSVNFTQFNDEMDLNMGGGNDYVMMTNISVDGESEIRLGGGEDTIGLYSSTMADTEVNGNGRFDVFENFDNNFDELEERSIEDDFEGGLGAMIGQARNEVDAFNDAIVLAAFFGLGG